MSISFQLISGFVLVYYLGAHKLAYSYYWVWDAVL